MIPTDADFDHMHHALGRPDGPHVVPYRNRFCCATGGPDACRFEALGLWERGGSINEGRDTYYCVTEEGRRLLMAWLAVRQRAQGLRLWRVEGGGLTPRTVLAKSPAAAKYDVWLEISDTWPVGFGPFVRSGVKARLA